MPPRTPSAQNGECEARVLLNFVVLEGGSIGDPIVERSSGVRAFERAAMRVVKTWQYQPASVDGEPVEQCHTQVMINFSGPKNGDLKGATRAFQKRFQRVVSSLQEGRRDDANVALDELATKKGLNHYEGARVALLRARIAKLDGDDELRLRWLGRATVWRGKAMEPELYRATLSDRFALEVQRQRYTAALKTWEKLEALDHPRELDDVYAKAQQQIAALQDGGAAGGSEPRSRPKRIGPGRSPRAGAPATCSSSANLAQRSS